MPHLLDTEDRVAILVRVSDRILATEGTHGLSLRAVSRASGISTSSLLHHLGSTERILGICGTHSLRARLRDLTRAVIDDGPLALLPRDSAEVSSTRTWLGWHDLARSRPDLRPDLEQPLTQLRRGERAVLARAVDHAIAAPDLEEVHALVDGLRMGLGRTGQDLVETGRDDARRCLARRLGSVLGDEVRLGEPLVPPDSWGWPYVAGPRAVARGGWATEAGRGHLEAI